MYHRFQNICLRTCSLSDFKLLQEQSPETQPFKDPATQLLRNRDTKKELSVSWDGHKLTLSNHPHPLYLVVPLDRTFTSKNHLQNTKAEVNTRNNILHKLVNSKWGGGSTNSPCNCHGPVFLHSRVCLLKLE